MVKIEVVIQPSKLDSAREALKNIGIDGLTVSEVRGHGRQKGHKEVYRGREYQVDLLHKIKLEIAVNDAFVQPTIDAIMQGARTGKIGDGKVFVFDLEQTLRVRTGETGGIAIG